MKAAGHAHAHARDAVQFFDDDFSVAAATIGADRNVAEIHGGARRLHRPPRLLKALLTASVASRIRRLPPPLPAASRPSGDTPGSPLGCA